MEPEFKKAAEALKEHNVKLATVDCVDNEKLCASHGIRGYPTLKVLNNAKESEYDGHRDSSGIIKYMKKQVMPAVTKLTPDQLESFTKNEEVVVVGVFPPGSKEETTFAKLAELLRNEHTFAAITPGIYMFKSFDEKFATLPTSAATDEKAMHKWISSESTPLMAEVGPENYSKYASSGLPLAYLFYEKDAMRSEYGPIVEDIMRAHKGVINAVYIDSEKFEGHAKSLAIEEDAKMPAFVIHEVEGDLKYPFNAKTRGALTKESLTKFVTEYVSGKMEPTYRSEAIPEKNTDPLKVVVYNNFESIVMDPKKDVLLELYAPWCGACKRIAPTFEEVAKLYGAQEDKIIIAKMDGSSNDLPKSAGITLTKFPTFILFKAAVAGKEKERVPLEHPEDTVKSFVEFIDKNATNKVAIPSKEKEEL